MHPERAARLISTFGAYLLVAALILRVISLVMTVWQVRVGLQDTPVQPAIPTYSKYQPSPDGKSIIFSEQTDASEKNSWFQMDLDGGQIASAQPPLTDMQPFLVSDGSVYLQAGDQLNPKSGLPIASNVDNYSRSPDGTALVFTTPDETGNWGLYILLKNDMLYWLGDQEQINDVVWAPDSQSLAFIATVNGVDQLFITRRDGQLERQLTNDSSSKNYPRWSPDGRAIAYISSAVSEDVQGYSKTHHIPYPSQLPAEWSIDLISAAGGKPQVYLKDENVKFDLAWGQSSTGPILLYSTLPPNQLKTSYLFAIDPVTSQVRRVYPPQQIKSIDCPSYIQAGHSGTVHIVLMNSGSNSASVPLVLRAKPGPFAKQGQLDSGVILTESVQVPALSLQTIDLPVKAQSGLFTHISALINPNGQVPMDEKRCTVKNTYYGLPNLLFLPTTLPLLVSGMVLCLPWLLRRKSTALWILYLAYPLLTLILLILETRTVGM